MLTSFSASRTPGAPTDEEQDLLRAMIVFSAAGLDAMLKRLIEDCLTIAIEKSPACADKLAKFLKGRMRDFLDEIGTSERTDQRATGAALVAKLLVSKDSRKDATEMLIDDLTGDSLQSFEQITKAMGYLGLEIDALTQRKAELKEAFHARNDIVHEMDINLGAKNRSRTSRAKNKSVEYANEFLGIAETILHEAISRLARKQRSRANGERETIYG